MMLCRSSSLGQTGVLRVSYDDMSMGDRTPMRQHQLCAMRPARTASVGPAGPSHTKERSAVSTFGRRFEQLKTETSEANQQGHNLPCVDGALLARAVWTLMQGWSVRPYVRPTCA